MTSKARNKFSPEVRARAVRMVLDHEKNYPSLWAAMSSISAKIGWAMMAMLVLVPISSVIGDRLGYYLIPIQTMIFTRLPSLPLGANKRLLVVAPYVALFVVLATWTTFSLLFDRCYVPYQTWLFGFPAARYYFQ